MLQSLAMHEVVRLLRAEKSVALQELIELERAFHEISKNLVSLAGMLRDLDAEARHLAVHQASTHLDQVQLVRDVANRTMLSAEQIVLAFEEVENGIAEWRIERRDNGNA